MRNARVWARLLGVERTVVERVEFDEAADAVVIHVRPQQRERGRCGRCRRRCPGYDAGGGRRRWRAPDLGLLRTYLEADAPRVRCAEHGVLVAAVPWARHDAGHTRSFDDTCAWLAAQCSKRAVTELLRVAWRSVGAIVARVVADAAAARDPLAGLTRIGIDEISYRRGYRYLTVVVDHDSGRLVWAADGHDAASLHRFFDLLGAQRAAAIELVSADSVEWIAQVIATRAPQAVLCIDPFHVVRWASQALDELRRELWNAARRGGDRGAARLVRGTRWLLRRHPEQHSTAQARRLAELEQINSPLYRGYLLVEQLRLVFALRGEAGIALLDDWLAWAAGSDLPRFVATAAKIERHRPGIEASLRHGLSNGRVEGLNTRIRLITRIAFGFHSAAALIALAMLRLGGYCPPLPGRDVLGAHI